jgi:electron transfer flavoprotein alpha subunit
VLAINPDADAPIFDHADVGIVADWRAAIPLLVDQLASAV